MKRHLMKLCYHSVLNLSVPTMFITFLSFKSLFMQIETRCYSTRQSMCVGVGGSKLAGTSGYKVNRSGLYFTGFLKMAITLRAQNYIWTLKH